MKQVKVDFSTTVRNGLIRASQRRASEPLDIGDRVEAFDPDEDLSFVGVVTETDDNFAYLRMEWELIPRNEPGQTLSIGSFGSEGPVPMPATAAEAGDGGVIAATSSINPSMTSFVVSA